MMARNHDSSALAEYIGFVRVVRNCSNHAPALGILRFAESRFHKASLVRAPKESPFRPIESSIRTLAFVTPSERPHSATARPGIGPPARLRAQARIRLARGLLHRPLNERTEIQRQKSVLAHGSHNHCGNHQVHLSLPSNAGLVLAFLSDEVARRSWLHDRRIRFGSFALALSRRRIRLCGDLAPAFSGARGVLTLT
jgi:hypothetical protein